MRIRSLVWKAILILNLIKLNQNMVIEHMQEERLFVSNLLFEEQWPQPGIKPFFPSKSGRKALPYNLSKAEGRKGVESGKGHVERKEEG